MSKIKMLVCLSGSHGVTLPGEVYECDADEAKRMIEAGLAAPVQEAKKSEKRPSAKAVESRAEVSADDAA